MGLPPHDPFEPRHYPGIAAARGISCLSCEYDLTGLNEDSDCPECGRPVAHSTERARLRAAPIEIIRRVHRGLRLVFWLVIAGMFGGFLVAIMAMFFAPSVAGAQVLTTVVGVTLGGLSLYGWYLLTTSIPLMPDHDRTRTIRMWLLTLLTVALLSTAVQGATTSGATPGASLGLPAILLVTVSILTTVLGVAVYFFQIAYLRRLAEFVPDLKLVQRFKTLFLFLCIGVPLYLVFTIAMIVMGYFAISGSSGSGAPTPGASFATGGLMLSGFMMCGVSIGALVFFVMYLVGLYQIGSRVGDALRAAERFQQSVSSGPISR